MSYNLFLDDERQPQNVKWINLPLVDWVIVKNYNQFVETIQNRGVPLRISFDNDLAPDHYNTLIEQASKNPRYLENHPFEEKTGYDCAKWLVGYCLSKGGIDLPEYYIHTMNPIAKEYIKSLLESYMKSK